MIRRTYKYLRNDKDHPTAYAVWTIWIFGIPLFSWETHKNCR